MKALLIGNSILYIIWLIVSCVVFHLVNSTFVPEQKWNDAIAACRGETINFETSYTYHSFTDMGEACPAMGAFYGLII